MLNVYRSFTPVKDMTNTRDTARIKKKTATSNTIHAPKHQTLTSLCPLS